jgi:predicted Zn-ribbon and HTH transcriptional regulator
MHFVATQRCPNCRSEKTAVQLLPPSGDTRAAVETAVVIWTCQSCGHQFPPHDRPNRNPVLICGKCHEPTVHQRAWLEPRTEVGPRGLAIRFNEHIMQCQLCQATRPWGREYPRAAPGQVGGKAAA